MAKQSKDIVLKSGSEFIKNCPELKTMIVSCESTPDNISFCFERSVSDVVFSKEQAREFIKILLDFI